MNDIKLNDQKSKLLMKLLNDFNPLIEKYSRKLNYSEAKTDLIICLIVTIIKIRRVDNIGQIVNYITKSIKHEYIRLSKKRQEYLRHECQSENIFVSEENYFDPDLSIDVKNAISILTDYQKKIIILKYYYGYSDSEIALLLQVTRQAINKAKRNSLNKMRILLTKG